MNDFIILVREVVLTPGFAFRIGIMIAIAIALGAWLYNNWKDLWKWFVTGVVYIIFQEWIRLLITENVGIMLTPRPAILAVSASTLFGLGIIAGAYTVKKGYEKAEEIRKKRIGADTQQIKDTVNKIVRNGS